MNPFARGPPATTTQNLSVARQVQVLVLGILLGHLGTSLWSGRLGQLLREHVPLGHPARQIGEFGLGRRELVTNNISATLAPTANLTDPEQADLLPILQSCCNGEHKEVIVAVVSKVPNALMKWHDANVAMGWCCALHAVHACGYIHVPMHNAQGAYWDNMATVWAESLAAVNASQHTLVGGRVWKGGKGKVLRGQDLMLEVRESWRCAWVQRPPKNTVHPDNPTCLCPQQPTRHVPPD